MKDALIRIINDRKRRAIDCKNTNIVTPAAMIQYSEKTHFTIIPYWPERVPKKPWNLPRTFASGPILGTDYWTDGAFILRSSPYPDEDTVEFKVKTREFIRHVKYAKGAKFVCSAYHDDFHTCRLMCVVHEKGVSFFHIHYADHAFNVSRQEKPTPRSKICIGMNADNSACVFKVGKLVTAVISPCGLPSHIEPKLRVQVENYYADYRNRPEPVEHRSVRAGARKKPTVKKHKNKKKPVGVRKAARNSWGIALRSKQG